MLQTLRDQSSKAGRAGGREQCGCVFLQVWCCNDSACSCAVARSADSHMGQVPSATETKHDADLFRRDVACWHGHLRKHNISKQESGALGVQVQQQEHDAWQTFCAVSVRVVPSEAAAAAASAPMQEGVQGGQELYQHRLPQLADRMQRLLSEAPLMSQPAQGVFTATQHPSSVLPPVVAACILIAAAAQSTDDAVLHGNSRMLWAMHRQCSGIRLKQLSVISCPEQYCIFCYILPADVQYKALMHGRTLRKQELSCVAAKKQFELILMSCSTGTVCRIRSKYICT